MKILEINSGEILNLEKFGIDGVSAVIGINQELIGEEILSKEEGFDLLYGQLNEIPYCDITLYDMYNYKISIRLSYSKYFELTNAYLGNLLERCEQVQQGFITNLLSFHYENNNGNQLMAWFCNNLNIMVTQVDIPFGYYIGIDDPNNCFKNIHRVVSKVYALRNERAIPKGISICSEELKANTIMEFPYFNILAEYLEEFKNYVLCNLFDVDIINQVYREQIEVLKSLLVNDRQYPWFNYENFILSHLDEIWDYEIMVIAVIETTSDINGTYNAISNIRKTLQEVERQTGIIFIDTKEAINDTINYFYNMINN